jgi:3-methyladenine DNA glycosylase AlkD
VDAALRAAGDPDRADQERRYLKSDLVHYGVTVPALRRIVRTEVRAAGPLAHDRVVAAVLLLWDEPATDPVHERRAAAVELLEMDVGLLAPDDLPVLERLLRESRTWALVDNLAASVVGPLLEAHPEALDVLDRWVADDDVWLRRAALLALLVPLREGRGDWERFAGYADRLLEEREFFIRKAIGWVLRDTSRRRPELVAAWLAPRTGRASGVTVREAVKRLPDATRTELLVAYREHRPARLA